MNSAIKSLQMVRVALLASIVLYAVVGELVAQGKERPQNIVFFVFTALAVVMVIVSFMVRKMLIARAEAGIAAEAESSHALHRWRGGYMVSFAFSEAIALLGFVLRALGFTLSQVAPFYIVGFFLLLFFGPRRPTQEMPTVTS